MIRPFVTTAFADYWRVAQEATREEPAKRVRVNLCAHEWSDVQARRGLGSFVTFARCCLKCGETRGL